MRRRPLPSSHSVKSDHCSRAASARLERGRPDLRQLALAQGGRLAGRGRVAAQAIEAVADHGVGGGRRLAGRALPEGEGGEHDGEAVDAAGRGLGFEEVAEQLGGGRGRRGSVFFGPAAQLAQGAAVAAAAGGCEGGPGLPFAACFAAWLHRRENDSFPRL